jgi:hypothetical protein
VVAESLKLEYCPDYPEEGIVEIKIPVHFDKASNTVISYIF